MANFNGVLSITSLNNNVEKKIQITSDREYVKKQRGSTASHLLYVVSLSIFFQFILKFKEHILLNPKLLNRYTIFRIMRLREFGLLDYIYKKGVANATECLKPISSTQSNELRTLALGDFYGVFSVYAGGEGGVQDI